MRHEAACRAEGKRSLADAQERLVEDMQRPRLAAAGVLRLLAPEASTGQVATPVDALAEALGLEVLAFNPQTRSAGTLGWLEPGESVIYLRPGLADPVRRFTLAHELGHFVLHRRRVQPLADPAQALRDALRETLDSCETEDLSAPLDPAQAADETLRPGQAYSPRAEREAEANLFAAALLLPAPRLLAEYQASAAGPDRLRGLAERFEVSEDVLLRRLAALLLATPDELAAGDGQLASPMRTPAQLDDWQLAAAQADTPALVVAGPGTGKTSTLVARVLHLVRERETPPEAILALTFSNKAAREMRERLRAGLSAGDTGATGTGMPPEERLPAVSTIHAFCGNLLRRYATLVGLRPDFRLITETDGYLLLRTLVAELPLRHYQSLASPGIHFPTLLAAISRAKDELYEPAQLVEAARAQLTAATDADAREAAERALEVGRVYLHYQAELMARGDADFGDVIRLAVRLLRQHPEVLAQVRAQYQHVLVDEFQDINRAMGVLIQTLTGEAGPLWAVGDADQAIYRFRGASPANLTRFTTAYRDAHVYPLRRNYRSVPDILEAAAAVAGQALDGVSAAARSALEAERAASGCAVHLAQAPDEAAELAGLAAAIRERARQGRPLGEQVVLCRTRRQGQRIAAALAAAGLRTRMQVPLLEHDEVKDVLAVLALVADRSGAGLLRAGRLADHPLTRHDVALLLAEARRAGLSPLAIVLREPPPDGLSADGTRGITTLRAIVRALWDAPDVATGLARYLFALTEQGRHLLAGVAEGSESGRARAAAQAQLLALARAFEDRRLSQRAGDMPLYPTFGGAAWAEFLDYVRIVTTLRQEGSGPADEVAGEQDGVRILTVHASKGLEFPVVYLPGLVERRFPMQRRGGTVLLPPSPEEQTPADPAAAHLAEEACLFYVALTRARDELVLSYALQYGRMRYHPSRFLAPIQQRLGDALHAEHWIPPVPPTVEETRDPELLPLPVPAGADAEPEPLRVAAIETYNRCPRQYAYRYVYGLRPQEVGLATLRRALHETLDVLHTRFGEAARNPATTSAPTTAEARQIFDERWQRAVGQERAAAESVGVAGEPRGGTTSDPFHEVYRRHGHHVVERLYKSLALDPAEPDGSAPARLGSQARFEQTATVRIGEHAITMTLDRVEHAERERAASGRGARTTGGAAAEPPAATRVVRHRLGRDGQAQPDLRTLLYALAAEQGATPANTELQQHNLSTGAIEPIKLQPRQAVRLRESLESTLAGIRRGEYPPHPDPTICAGCPFLLICPI
jgi:DNA helicase-2/ATP-dependent DNA helicase PcrA